LSFIEHWVHAGLLPKRQDVLRVMALGMCLYFNQLFYIIGIHMSGVVVATCMQPTIPVFTAMIAVLLNLEAGSLQKFIGIALAVGGSICMVSLISATHAASQ
jgi:drug/metabolite transporter (DMT)-like permease